MSEELIQEQQPPADGTGSDYWLLVLEDMQTRRLLGIEKYGKPVRSDNGRDALTDAYQEELDKIVYLRQAIEQTRALREDNVRLQSIVSGLAERIAAASEVIARNATKDALKRLEAWQKQATVAAGGCTQPYQIENDCGYIKVCLGRFWGQKAVAYSREPSRPGSQGWARNVIIAGTDDKPATLAETILAALDLWHKLYPTEAAT